MKYESLLMYWAYKDNIDARKGEVEISENVNDMVKVINDLKNGYNQKPEKYLQGWKGKDDTAIDPSMIMMIVHKSYRWDVEGYDTKPKPPVLIYDKKDVLDYITIGHLGSVNGERYGAVFHNKNEGWSSHSTEYLGQAFKIVGNVEGMKVQNGFPVTIKGSEAEILLAPLLMDEIIKESEPIDIYKILDYKKNQCDKDKVIDAMDELNKVFDMAKMYDLDNIFDYSHIDISRQNKKIKYKCTCKARWEMCERIAGYYCPKCGKKAVTLKGML